MSSSNDSISKSYYSKNHHYHRHDRYYKDYSKSKSRNGSKYYNKYNRSRSREREDSKYRRSNREFKEKKSHSRKPPISQPSEKSKNNIIINKSNSLKHKEGKLFAPKLKITDINNINAFKENINKNIINTFKSKTINIVKPSHISEKTKSMPKNFYERFHTNDNINEKYNYKNIPLKLMESKSNSKEKINKVLKKFEKNIINFSKQYCATLNQQNDSKIKNTSSSNEKKKKNRPSTAVFKNKNNKYNNEGFIIYNERNYTDGRIERFMNLFDEIFDNCMKYAKSKGNTWEYVYCKILQVFGIEYIFSQPK